MDQKNDHFHNETLPDSSFESSSDIINSVELQKFRQIISSGWGWIILIITLTITLAYLYVRYTKPIYSAQSILKLDIKNEASLLGLQNPYQQDIQGISGEIEILKSKLFLSQVVDEIAMNVSYYHPGRSFLMVDERYGNSPFKLQFELKNNHPLNKRFNLEILNNEEFSLSNFDNSIITANHHFGIPLVTNDFEFIIHKTHFFESQKESSKFYFIINSKEALINYLKQNTTVEPVNWNAKTIKISFTDPNPTKTRNLLQAIDTLYLEFTKNAKNKAVEQKITFLDTQMGRTSKKLNITKIILRILPLNTEQPI